MLEDNSRPWEANWAAPTTECGRVKPSGRDPQRQRYGHQGVLLGGGTKADNTIGATDEIASRSPLTLCSTQHFCDVHLPPFSTLPRLG